MSAIVENLPSFQFEDILVVLVVADDKNFKISPPRGKSSSDDESSTIGDCVSGQIRIRGLTERASESTANIKLERKT